MSELYSKLSEMIDRACAQCPAGGSLEVYILAGLGGGSGCFVDVCYLVREVLEYQSRKSTLEGYLFLPDMFESHPYFQQAQSQLQHMRANSYAAVKEVNYLMEIPENKDIYS